MVVSYSPRALVRGKHLARPRGGAEIQVRPPRFGSLQPTPRVLGASFVFKYYLIVIPVAISALRAAVLCIPALVV